MLAFIVTALFCLLVTNVYALFGHGVRSRAMDLMLLYPLLGGVLGHTPRFGLFASPGRFRRLGASLFASGLAALTVGAMLRGILEIAGTASAYTAGFTAVGWVLTGTGALFSPFFHRSSPKPSPEGHPGGVS